MEKNAIGNFCCEKFSWIGYPDDLGVKNVGGRPGAALGPSRFLEVFSRLNGKSDLKSAMRKQLMVAMTEDLSENHERAFNETTSLLQETGTSDRLLLAVGGGHDYAYPWMRAMVQAAPRGMRIGCLNLDAHFDLRAYAPQMTSGSPFRKLIDEKLLDPAVFTEFGIQNHCNSGPLFEYAKEKGIRVVPMTELRNQRAVEIFRQELQRLSSQCDQILISLDLDAISFAYAPGVSAPQAEGFTASEIFQMLEIAGSDKRVTSLGIFELAPALDFQDLTSRLAAQAAWHFLNAKLQC